MLHYSGTLWDQVEFWFSKPEWVSGQEGHIRGGGGAGEMMSKLWGKARCHTGVKG